MTPVAPDPVVAERLLRVVRSRTGFDLTGYRTDGLDRRARQRAGLLGHADLAAYLAHLADDEHEPQALLDHLLVQVSGWFRDAHVWTSLREQVLPGLAARSGGVVRAWVAGCGEGQEVWSLAACLARAESDGLLRSWSVLATDVDDHALALLARATYPAVRLPETARDLLAPHLDHEGSTWQVRPSLTERVRCLRHDVRDAPPEETGGPVELVMCRNLLMYLDDEVQLRVVDGLIASVRPGGVVVLGQAELPLGRREALVPLDLAARVYRSIAVPLDRGRG